MQEYKEMYLTLMRAVESAVRTLVEAQQKCEELYMTVSDEVRSENRWPPKDGRRGAESLRSFGKRCKPPPPLSQLR